MRITELILYTNTLEKEQGFYQEVLGFDLTDSSADSFSIRIGWSKLTFQRSEKKHRYHYCFLIPRNKLQEGVDWLKKRLDIIEIEPGQFVQRFESWNANSVYFYDGSGNIAEFIVRHDLDNDSNTSFSSSDILCVNEIGMPTKNVEALNEQLENQMNSPFWKGDLKRFATNGTQEGLFLLPNYQLKPIWFPVDLPIEPTPFEAVISTDKGVFDLTYQQEILTIKKKESN